MDAAQMPLLNAKLSTDYLSLAKTLAQEFAGTAIERDRSGGTPQKERDRIRHSGLLNLVIPETYGGSGQNWITAMQISREFAKVDSSIAHVYSYHNLGVTVPHIFGSQEQKAHYYSQTVRNSWFWCNALNPLDKRTVLTSTDPHHFRLNGTKSFCSGSKDSDILPITAAHQDTGALVILAIPTQRDGSTIHDDWDNMGQRQTDSGSISFHDVVVHPTELFGDRSQPAQPFATIRACLTQLNLANIYLGIAQGAFDAAKQYTRTTTRPWLTSGVESATQDPYILKHFGELWVDLQAATCLTDKAAEQLQFAWEQEWSLTAEQRGSCAIAIAAAKVAATKAALRVANEMFEVMGARSTASQYGFDRYWRNLRTFTLHDPLDYKLRDLANWALNEEFPQPNFYI
jgi:alkylation response protein AidB-like acyl-CoA dehydrogenase